MPDSIVLDRMGLVAMGGGAVGRKSARRISVQGRRHWLYLALPEGAFQLPSKFPGLPQGFAAHSHAYLGVGGAAS